MVSYPAYMERSSRLVGEVLGVCATGLSPGTNATELTAVLPTDTAYCARLSMRASGVLRVVERRSAEEVAAKKLEARAREPLGQGVGDLPLGPHLNEIDGALSGVLLHRLLVLIGQVLDVVGKVLGTHVGLVLIERACY